MNKKKLYVILGAVPLAFILFLIALKFKLPGMLLAVIILVIIVGILYRTKPELFSGLKYEKKPEPDLYSNRGLSSEPIRHDSNKKTYLELTSVNASSSRSIIMEKAVMIVGRDKSCDCTLDNPEVSGRHLRLEYREADNLCYAIDLGSTNHTLLNGIQLVKDEPRVIKQGDILQIANEAYQVEYAHF